MYSISPHGVAVDTTKTSKSLYSRQGMYKGLFLLLLLLLFFLFLFLLFLLFLFFIFVFNSATKTVVRYKLQRNYKRKVVFFHMGPWNPSFQSTWGSCLIMLYRCTAPRTKEEKVGSLRLLEGSDSPWERVTEEQREMPPLTWNTPAELLPASLSTVLFLLCFSTNEVPFPWNDAWLLSMVFRKAVVSLSEEWFHCMSPRPCRVIDMEGYMWVCRIDWPGLTGLSLGLYFLWVGSSPILKGWLMKAKGVTFSGIFNNESWGNPL